MNKVITLRLDEETYRLFAHCAEEDNRPLSNFIETVAKRFIREHELVDEYEMKEIRSNGPLKMSLRRGYRDADSKKGRFVE